MEPVRDGSSRREAVHETRGHGGGGAWERRARGDASVRLWAGVVHIRKWNRFSDRSAQTKHYKTQSPHRLRAKGLGVALQRCGARGLRDRRRTHAVTEAFQRVSMNGVREDILLAQHEALGLQR